MHGNDPRNDLRNAKLEDLIALGEAIGRFAAAAVYDDIHKDKKGFAFSQEFIQRVEHVTRYIDRKNAYSGAGEVAVKLRDAMGELFKRIQEQTQEGDPTLHQLLQV